VTAENYRRSVAITQRGVRHTGWIDVRRAARRPALAVDVSPSLAKVVPAVLGRVKHAFDLSCDPAIVAAALGELAADRPGLRVPGTVDGFELAMRAVIGQQITVRAARTMLGRLVATFGEALDPPHSSSVSRLFPTAARISACETADLTALG
jgi:AraC family transcriptional regulator of adaptative response / DNA-3-methyladenine glycosylase II